ERGREVRDVVGAGLLDGAAKDREVVSRGQVGEPWILPPRLVVLRLRLRAGLALECIRHAFVHNGRGSPMVALPARSEPDAEGLDGERGALTSSPSCERSADPPANRPAVAELRDPARAGEIPPRCRAEADDRALSPPQVE